MNIWLTNFCDCHGYRSTVGRRSNGGRCTGVGNGGEKKRDRLGGRSKKSRDKSNAECRDKKGDMTKGTQE